MPTFVKLLGIGLLLSLMGCYGVQRDLRLKVWGKKTEATITDAWMSSGDSLKSRRDKVKVELLFNDEKGEVQKTEVILKDESELSADLKHMQIVYLPGNPRVMEVSGRSSYMSYIFLLLGVVMGAGGIIMFYKEPVVASHASEHEMPKGKIHRALDHLSK